MENWTFTQRTAKVFDEQKLPDAAVRPVEPDIRAWRSISRKEWNFPRYSAIILCEI